MNVKIRCLLVVEMSEQRSVSDPKIPCIGCGKLRTKSNMSRHLRQKHGTRSVTSSVAGTPHGSSDRDESPSRQSVISDTLPATPPTVPAPPFYIWDIAKKVIQQHHRYDSASLHEYLGEEYPWLPEPFRYAIIISAASAACHVANKGLMYALGREAPELAMRQSTINAGGALTYWAEGLEDIPGYRPLPSDLHSAGSQGVRLRQGRDSSSTRSTAKETTRGDWTNLEFPVSRNDSDVTFEQQAAEERQRPILGSFGAGQHVTTAEPPIDLADHPVTTTSEGQIFTTVNMETCAELGMVTAMSVIPSSVTKLTPASTTTMSTMDQEPGVDAEPPTQLQAIPAATATSSELTPMAVTGQSAMEFIQAAVAVALEEQLNAKRTKWGPDLQATEFTRPETLTKYKTGNERIKVVSRKDEGTPTIQTSEAARPIPAASELTDTLQRAMVQSGICQSQNLEQEDSVNAAVEQDSPDEEEGLIIMAPPYEQLTESGSKRKTSPAPVYPQTSSAKSSDRSTTTQAKKKKSNPPRSTVSMPSSGESRRVPAQSNARPIVHDDRSSRSRPQRHRGPPHHATYAAWRNWRYGGGSTKRDQHSYGRDHHQYGH